MNAWALYLKNILHNFLIFLKWILLACTVGITVGLISILFHHCIELATNYRLSHPLILYLLPLGGVLIVFFYRISGNRSTLDTNLVLLSIRSPKDQLPLKMAPLIFISTTVTHIFGGSSGREGAALQLGGSLSAFIGKCLHLDEKDLRIITMCGMSAAFSALFGTPLTAAIFSLEVVSVGIMYYVALVPCTLSAIVGYTLARNWGKCTHFSLQYIPTFEFWVIIRVIIFAILCAVLSVMFCAILHGAHTFYKRFIKNQYLRIIIGSIFIIILTLLLGTRDYLGAGMPIINEAIDSTVSPYAFLLKMLFTAITLGAGFKGGEIVPAFFIGATFGNMIGEMLGLSSSFCAGLGLIAVFCGVTNCPITSFIMSIELFGAEGSLFFLLAISISYMLSGYSGLYHKQKIMYSKFKPELINHLTT